MVGFTRVYNTSRFNYLLRKAQHFRNRKSAPNRQLYRVAACSGYYFREFEYNSSNDVFCRKTRVSGELDREVALSAAQTSAKLPAATPLNPVTPLRWKSTKRLESEKRKLLEEVKAKEVIKEEKKNLKLTKEEKKDQSKMVTTSKSRVNGTDTSHIADSQISTPATSQEETRFTSSASTSESAGAILFNGKAGELKDSHIVANGGSNEHAKQCEEASAFSAKQEPDQTAGDNSGTDR